MNRLGYGIIGVGFFGEKHIQVLSQLPNVKILGICRRSLQPLKELAKKYNIPNIYTDYRKLIANKEIKVVSITTHIDNHLKPTLAALRAGKHVFLEKPMAKNVSECELIIEAAKATDKIFMVGHICRFDPRYAIAKRSIEEGRIGRIVSLYARRNIPAAISKSVLAKIGPLMGDGVHDTDLMLWYTKDKVKTVYARTLSVRDLPNPDLGWAMLEFKSGAIGIIETIWYLPGKTPFDIDSRMEIVGTKGAIYIGGSEQGVMINDKTGWRIPDTYYWPRVHDQRVGVLKEELTYFINCILSEKKPEVITPEESREAVRVMTAAEKSAKTGEVVTIM